MTKQEKSLGNNENASTDLETLASAVFEVFQEPPQDLEAFESYTQEHIRRSFFGEKEHFLRNFSEGYQLLAEELAKKKLKK